MIDRQNEKIGRNPEVVCIGACCADITLTGVARRDMFGDTYGLAEEVTYCVGGDALNEAVTLAKLGHRTTFMGRVGDDFVGEFIIREGSGYGIDMSHVTKDSSCQTYNPIAIVGENDKREFYWKKAGKMCIRDRKTILKQRKKL